MCGRYQLQLDAQGVAALHQGAAWRDGHADLHSARNQVRPTTMAPVLVRTAGSRSSTVTADVVMMRVGVDTLSHRSRVCNHTTRS